MAKCRKCGATGWCATCARRRREADPSHKPTPGQTTLCEALNRFTEAGQRWREGDVYSLGLELARILWRGRLLRVGDRLLSLQLAWKAEPRLRGVIETVLVMPAIWEPVILAVQFLEYAFRQMMHDESPTTPRRQARAKRHRESEEHFRRLLAELLEDSPSEEVPEEEPLRFVPRINLGTMPPDDPPPDGRQAGRYIDNLSDLLTTYRLDLSTQSRTAPILTDRLAAAAGSDMALEARRFAWDIWSRPEKWRRRVRRCAVPECPEPYFIDTSSGELAEKCPRHPR